MAEENSCYFMAQSDRLNTLQHTIDLIFEESSTINGGAFSLKTSEILRSVKVSISSKEHTSSTQFKTACCSKRVLSQHMYSNT